MPRSSLFSSALAVSLLAGPFLLVYGQSFNEMKKEAGVTGGLVAVLGASNKAKALEAGQSEKFLVHCLLGESEDLQAFRKSIREAKKYGIVSAMAEDPAVTGNRLPYAGNLINILVGDLSKLKFKPSDDEIKRVLVPGGVAYVSGRKIKKPADDGHGTWSARYFDASGSSVSDETKLGVPNGVKWLAWYQSYQANYHGLTGFSGQELRLADGKAFMGNLYAKNGKKDVRIYHDARDAYNGVSLWLKKTNQNRRRLGAHLGVHKKIFLSTEENNGALFGYDTETGEKKYEYGKLNKSIASGHKAQYVAHGDNIFVSNGDMIGSYKLEGAKANWEKPEKGLVILPRYDKDKKRLIYALSPLFDDGTKAKRGSGRVPAWWVSALVCRNAETGEEIWRTTEFVGKGQGKSIYPTWGNLIIHEDHIAAFGPMMYSDPYLGIYKMSDGKRLWHHAMQGFQRGDYREWRKEKGAKYWGLDEIFTIEGSPDTKGTWWGTTAFFKNGLIWAASSGNAKGYNILTGKQEKFLGPRTVNDRCVTATATANRMILGFGKFINDDDYSWGNTNISRGACGGSITPGYGMAYTQPNGQCGCFVRIRHAAGLSSGALPETVEDSKRLTKYAAAPKFGASGGASSSRALAKSNASQLVYVPAPTPVTSGSAIRNDWNNNDYVPHTETAPVTAGGLTYVAKVQEHLLEAKKGGKVEWSYQAGSRISGRPVVTEGVIVFGSHDGYIYALNASTGKPIWKFLAARADRRIVAFSQVESASPVFGVVLHNGKIVASAGHHPETDGGIYAWGLDPKTGAIAWKNVIATDTKEAPEDTKKFKGHRNNYVNSHPIAKGDFVGVSGHAMRFDGSEKGKERMMGITPETKDKGANFDKGDFPTALGEGADRSITPGGIANVSLSSVPGGLEVRFEALVALPVKAVVVDAIGRKVMSSEFFERVGTLPLASLNKGSFHVVFTGEGWQHSAKVRVHAGKAYL